MSSSVNSFYGESVEDASGVSTLVGLLRLRAESEPTRTAYTFLSDGEVEEAGLTYAELDRRARSIAAALLAMRAGGERVLLVYPAGLDYVAAFFGCLYAGAVAVPAYPPRQNASFQRLQSIVEDARPVVALTTGSILSKAKSRLAQWPVLESLRWVQTDDGRADLSGEWREPVLDGESLAFLQYTSGSTATPKGVMVSHENLLHNESLIQRAFRQTGESVIAGWLPLYHDMGLIGNVLQALYSGARCVLMSPVAFLQSPFRWLSAISRYRATTSGGPNFAYELCVNKITAEQRERLDLSSWDVAFNGAEPVRAATMERFAAAFGPCGFRRAAFHPCYGLAEATLLVSVSSGADAPVVTSFDTGALVNNRAQEVEAGSENSRALVGCGGELPGQEVVVVDPDTLARREDGRVGEVWVAGGSVARGYWDRPAETESVFGARLDGTGAGPFLRTGDLGFKRGGELFITGRLKDLIIIRGLNHYPHDIELTAERSHGAVRSGCVAAFSVEVEGEERLIVVQEVEPRFREDASGVLETVRLAVAREHEVQPHAVVLIRPGTIPKTSSGKIQRGACRSMFLEGRLSVVAEWVGSSGAAGDGPRAAAEPERLREAKDIEGWLVERLAARLGVEPSAIDANRSMLHYGLDSLTAVELAHSIETSLGVSLPMMSFLEETSIAELAERTAAQLALRGDSTEDFCAPGEDASARGLSYGQRTMWFLQQLAPESPAYNIAVPMRIRGGLDTAAMRRALQAVAERHECLRASFEEIDGEPVQRVREGAGLHFHEEDATRWGEPAVSDYLAQESLRPFDLSAGPLLRVNLLRLSPEEHLLQLVVHHIVADFWSLAVVMQELGILYEAEQTGTAAVLAPVALRYCDYARRQAETLASERGKLLQDYWREQLAGELPALNLPYDYSRPAMQTFRGASEELYLDGELSAALKALGRSNGATLYMTLLAAFQVLLHRYTGQEDLLVGTVTAGRGRAEWAGLVGYFVNPLTLRADLSTDESFESFLRQSRRTALSAFEHQDYPFAALVEDLQPERDLSRSPIFQVMFVLQRAHLLDKPGLASFALGRAGASVPMADLTVESVAPTQQVAQYDLVMMMAEDGEGLAASLQYNADLFRPETMARMLGHFRELLASIVREPARRVSTLNILPPAERRQLLSAWNETGSPGPQVCVHRMFEVQAEKTPDALAVVSGTERLTYRELNERADLLAAHLRGMGVGPEALVGVCLERSAKMALAVLAVLKAGGAYVPLDPSHPAERLRLTLEDSGARALLTRRGLAEMFEGLDAHAVCLDSDWETVSAAAVPAGAVEVTGENLAYMIYTSGSTGVPKGVAVRHAGLSNLVNWHQLAYGVTSGDRATLLAGPAFDASVWELWPYLTAGASMHVPEEATRASAPDLLKWLAAEGVTVSFLPTALAEAVLAEPMPADLALRVLLTGGDKLHQPPREGLPFTFVNHYGPTEYTVVATRAAVAAGSEGVGAPPIGRPIVNTRVYLLDARLQVVPVGVAGELYIGGDGLARGYHARPDLTAERFIPDAFSGEAGARLYRTGDLARYLPDGQLEFLSRVDNQVKIRGFRVELGEIEAALGRYPSMLHAVVLAREESAGDKRLVAYVVTEGGQVVTADELRGFLKELLPEYMVPSAFVRLEALPLTPNGKVDRKALPEPDRSAVDVEAAAPGNPVKEILAGIWAQILKTERVNVADNFFDLGGHSLLATQVVSRVREYFHVELPVRALFESPTVAGLAAEVERLMKGEQTSRTRPIVTVLRDGKLPLSFAQQRLWFLDRLAPGNPLYNIPAAVRLSGRLDSAVLEQSLNEIVRRHESLRTTFAAVEGRPVQVVAPSLALQLESADLSNLAESERDREVERLADAEARKPFDLSTGPLLRARILELAEGEHVLLLTIHHIVSDGWSMSVFVGELKALYEAFSSGKESPLPEPTAQYADFAHWQRRALDEGLLESDLEYWRVQLAGAQTVLAMPTDRARPPVQTYNGAAETFTLPADLTRSLKALSLAEGATLFMTLLAAFNALLYRHTGQRDISVGTPVAGRTSTETEGLIGLFVNTLVLRTVLSGSTSFRELLGGVRETALAAYVHQGVPFEKLVEELQPERDTSHSPLVQVMLAMQNAPAQALELAGLSLELMPPLSVAAKFELLLTMEESPEGLTGTLEYNTDLFDRETVVGLLGRFHSLLEGAAQNPEAEIAALPLLTFEERRRILSEFNQTGRVYPRATLHGLFEAQVARTPTATALVCG
ncbi:MAG: hypothetical protein QOH49_2607, partial [Acidobacteriota bacterium]|nr:hypothetical protein [Acidobacteriota bacterium]